jgi:hypothetical protein
MTRDSKYVLRKFFFIPRLGTFYSQAGNILFPGREQFFYVYSVTPAQEIMAAGGEVPGG